MLLNYRPSGSTCTSHSTKPPASPVNITQIYQRDPARQLKALTLAPAGSSPWEASGVCRGG